MGLWDRRKNGLNSASKLFLFSIFFSSAIDSVTNTSTYQLVWHLFISCRTNCIPCRSHNRDRRNSTQGYVVDWFLFLCYINYVLISVKVYLKIVRSILDIKGVRVNFGQTPLNNYSHRLEGSTHENLALLSTVPFFGPAVAT